MTRSASTFLMFEGKAEEAMNLYAVAFPDAAITSLERFGPNEAGPEGTVRSGRMRLAGHDLSFFDSHVKHGFTFTPSISIFVECESEEELERGFATLADGGHALMPLDNYGFSRRFGWIADRYGVTWQLNLQ